MRKWILALAAAAALSLMVVGTADAQQQQGGGKGGAKAGGGGNAKGKGKGGVPAGPTPRTPDGKVILDGEVAGKNGIWTPGDRKSTRLNSSHT